MSTLILLLTGAIAALECERAHNGINQVWHMRVTSETKIATRQRILQAAQKLFAEEGFESATTRDIARAAKIAVGTLFNYFPTKEAIVECLVSEAYAAMAEKFAGPSSDKEPRTLEEELFSCVATALRRLEPYRQYLPAVLESALSPLAATREGQSLRVAHLETVVQIVARHGHQDALTSLALQMYWTLFTGVLAFWATDRSPRQEDTLALLDQSIAMFSSWLTARTDPDTHRQTGG
jgi:AcrR family transcriptional regulator